MHTRCAHQCPSSPCSPLSHHIDSRPQISNPIFLGFLPKHVISQGWYLQILCSRDVHINAPRALLSPRSLTPNSDATILCKLRTHIVRGTTKQAQRGPLFRPKKLKAARAGACGVCREKSKEHGQTKTPRTLGGHFHATRGPADRSCDCRSGLRLELASRGLGVREEHVQLR